MENPRTAEVNLWAAVVMQAIDDIDNEQIGSLHWHAALAFFLHGGQWRRSRGDIADHLNVHADDLEHAGRRHINARLLAAGRPLIPVVVQPAPAARPEPATPEPAPPLPRLVAVLGPEPVRGRGGHRRHAYNPFDPFRALPSETRAKAAAG